MKEDIFMQLFNRVQNLKDQSIVCKLNKSIYRLWQTSREWYQILYNYFKIYNFTSTNVDLNIYTTNFEKGHFTTLVVYVYDCIVDSNYLHHIFDFKQLLEEFEVFHERDIDYGLNIQIIWNKLKNVN